MMEEQDDFSHEGVIIRPPSEADSILLQATLGCSHNKCAFCGAYKQKRFRIVPREVLLRDLAFAAKHCRRQRRVFLCDGDALIIPQKRLTELLQDIRGHLPWVTRVSTYANAKSLRLKSLEELRELRELGLRTVYMGLESGDDATLRAVNKGESAAAMVEQALRAKEAGLKRNVTVLLGLAGPRRSLGHATATAEALNAMQPEYAAALTLMLIPGTPLDLRAKAGEFQLPDAMAMLAELRELLAHLDIKQGQFFSNHASNYLPLALRLPKDKPRALELLDSALEGGVRLRQESLRRL